MVTYLAAAVLFFTGFAAFWAPLPLFLTGAGFTAAQIFGLYLVSSLASAALYDRVGTLVGRTDVRLLQTGALAARGLLFPLVALGTGFGLLALELGVVAFVLVLIGGTWAVIAVVGTAIVTRLAPAAVRGELLGVHTALAAVGGGVGGLLGGWAASFGYLLAFGVAGGLVVLGAALVWSLAVLSDREPVAGIPPVDAAEPSEPGP
ncbi:MAG: hypothetical protein U5J98_03220 [Halobacteriales archaeon]|nr:hypothetical protein [Halobacteriales archaeon]